MVRCDLQADDGSDSEAVRPFSQIGITYLGLPTFRKVFVLVRDIVHATVHRYTNGIAKQRKEKDATSTARPTFASNRTRSYFANLMLGTSNE